MRSYRTISPLPRHRGGIFSVALSVDAPFREHRPAVSRHAALWRPDFPPRPKAQRLPGRLAPGLIIRFRVADGSEPPPGPAAEPQRVVVRLLLLGQVPRRWRDNHAGRNSCSAYAEAEPREHREPIPSLLGVFRNPRLLPGSGVLETPGESHAASQPRRAWRALGSNGYLGGTRLTNATDLRRGVNEGLGQPAQDTTPSQ